MRKILISSICLTLCGASIHAANPKWWDINVDVASGATMNISGAGSGFVTGSGGITKNNAGVLFLGGSEQYTAPSGAILTINGGIVDFSGDTALGIAPASLQAAALTINSGTL